MTELVKRVQNGEKELINDIIDYYKPFINSYIKKYKGKFEDYEDLYQEAIITFIKAIYSYKTGKNSFQSYSGISIYMVVTKYVLMNIDRIPDLEYRDQIIKDTYEKCKRCKGHIPSDREYAEYYGMKVVYAKHIFDIMNNNQKTIDENSYDIMELTVEEICSKKIDMEILKNFILNSKLKEKQRKILFMRCGFDRDKDLTTREVSEIYGTSRQDIDECYRRAIKKLRLKHGDDLKRFI